KAEIQLWHGTCAPVRDSGSGLLPFVRPGHPLTDPSSHEACPRRIPGPDSAVDGQPAARSCEPHFTRRGCTVPFYGRGDYTPGRCRTSFCKEQIPRRIDLPCPADE